MNIADLSKIDIKDLKNIDMSKLQEQIMAKPDVAANVLVGVITLVLVLNIFGGRIGQINSLKSQIDTLDKKSTSIDQLQTAQKQLTDFVAALPEGITADEIIDKLTDFAALRDVRILSFSPAKEEHKTLFDRVSVNVNVVSKEYKKICLFIQDIEKSKYALRVERFNGTMSRETGPNNNPKEMLISTQIEVSSINFKK